MQKLVEEQEVASITIVKSNAGIREKYIAEISLTPAAAEKYSQLAAGISPFGKDSHFVCSIGNSREDVNRWKDNLLKEGR
ncbi:hypothetical protein GCM10007390_51600 [Persicitalea jodogahamensis]|uniref:Uncharacterized protein n=1 Tax=Persicitalea jodogahamensis TaxID=402147 RepID=A0A8J3DEB1_9BACT|nr:hypothetical protein GCM10007390_51600 [Persicitalea jodogahamensis]